MIRPLNPIQMEQAKRLGVAFFYVKVWCNTLIKLCLFASILVVFYGFTDNLVTTILFGIIILIAGIDELTEASKRIDKKEEEIKKTVTKKDLMDSLENYLKE